MQTKIIKETNRFKLEWQESLGLMPEGYCIYIKYNDEELELAHIYKIGADTQTIMMMCGTNFQDCITSWELFKDFVMLVDDAYERLDLSYKNKGSVVLD